MADTRLSARGRIGASGATIVRRAQSLIGRLTGMRRRREAALLDALSRARALHQQGKLAAAAESYRHLLSIHPAHFDTLLLLAMLELQRRNFPVSVELLSRALEARPADAAMWYHLGLGLFGAGRHEEALASYDEAVRLDPDEAKFWKDRGAALRRLGRMQDALDSYDRALELNPSYLEAHNGKGTTLHNLHRMTEALACYERALAIKPDEDAVLHNVAQCLMATGDYKGGWPGFERRVRVMRGLPERSLGLGSRWSGVEPLAGKSILLWTEPGLGEGVQFCRFVRMVAAKGARVLLAVPEQREAATLLPLLEGLDGANEILGAVGPVPKTDYHCPIESLPLALNIDLGNLPAEPYLHADPKRVAAWSARLGPRRLPRIGLVGSGNPIHTNDHNRSVPLRQLLELAEGPFEFICLHKEVREADLPWLEQRPDIRRFSDALTDFAETAALLQHIDVVISVDTSVAHLAGALGRPVWILLCYAPDWRWMLDRDDSPWYQTARLFRQPAAGDWQSVLATVTRELAATMFPAGGPETTHVQPARAERDGSPRA